MLYLEPANQKWWQKPLARADGRVLPAELIVLRSQLKPDESGAWLNSRGVTSGAVDLILDPAGRLRTVRVRLPDFVSEKLRDVYRLAGLKKGAPDLIVWNEKLQYVWFIEVKCPVWDKPSPEQRRFHEMARELGSECEVAEWSFRGPQEGIGVYD
jgi:hypothetical protein